MIPAEVDRKFLLVETWWLCRKGNGWLANMIHTFDISPAEEEMLCDLDDAMIEIDKKMDQWEKTVSRQERWGLMGLETDKENFDLLSKDICSIYKRYQEMAQADGAYADRFIYLVVSELEEKKDYLKKLRARILHTARLVSGNEETGNRIGERELEVARNFPLERLIGDLPKDGRIPCPLHGGEHRNFVVKNGWGFCHTCHRSIDAIGWLIEFKRLTFAEAVRQLSGKIN